MIGRVKEKQTRTQRETPNCIVFWDSQRQIKFWLLTSFSESSNELQFHSQNMYWVRIKQGQAHLPLMNRNTFDLIYSMWSHAPSTPLKCPWWEKNSCLSFHYQAYFGMMRCNSIQWWQITICAICVEIIRRNTFHSLLLFFLNNLSWRLLFHVEVLNDYLLFYCINVKNLSNKFLLITLIIPNAQLIKNSFASLFIYFFRMGILKLSYYFWDIYLYYILIDIIKLIFINVIKNAKIQLCLTLCRLYGL